MLAAVAAAGSRRVGRAARAAADAQPASPTGGRPSCGGAGGRARQEGGHGAPAARCSAAQTEHLQRGTGRCDDGGGTAGQARPWRAAGAAQGPATAALPERPLPTRAPRRCQAFLQFTCPPSWRVASKAGSNQNGEANGGLQAGGGVHSVRKVGRLRGQPHRRLCRRSCWGPAERSAGHGTALDQPPGCRHGLGGRPRRLRRQLPCGWGVGWLMAPEPGAGSRLLRACWADSGEMTAAQWQGRLATCTVGERCSAAASAGPSLWASSDGAFVAISVHQKE